MLEQFGNYLLRQLPPEIAHQTAIQALALGIGPRYSSAPQQSVTFLGHTLPNCVGIAAGFDKHAQAIEALFKMGFGFVELGGVTPKPQPGNPRPRMFRIPSHEALINRYGLNSVGVEVFASRIEAWREKGGRGFLGANIGQNKDSAEPIADYVTCTKRLKNCVDYLSVNVSSPNTPGLRGLQNKDQLEKLLDQVSAAKGNAACKILLKIAPDLTPEAAEDIAHVALKSDLDGLIIANTTLSRPKDLPINETGGLSGAPLRDLATQQLQHFKDLTAGKLPLIGVGGISSKADMAAKLEAGASLVQLYTGLVYQGPALLKRLIS